ncbi:MAG: hypothetical protein K8S55_15940 [Phycisphaerae bacterium]|nr:hypothetical protein [Phycisphaerae bacterium]
MSENPIKTGIRITAVSIDDAAKVLSAALRRKIDEEQIREIAEAGDLLRADGTINLLEYIAFLIREANRANTD